MTRANKNSSIAQHTPEPWQVESWDNFPDQLVITDETNKRCLALIDKSDEQAEANACLMAAAPDMLAALEAQQMAEYDPEASRRTGYFDRAREMRVAAIAKATQQ